MTASAVARRAAMHPITFVGVRAGQTSSSSLVLSGPPAGYKLGDLGIIVGRSGGVVATPAGWTMFAANIFYKYLSASEAAVTVSNSNTKFTAQYLVFRGVHPTSPLDAYSIKSNAAGATATSTPVVATANGVLLNILYITGTGTDRTITCNLGTFIQESDYDVNWLATAWGPPIHAGETSPVATWSTVSAGGGRQAAMVVIKAP